MMLSVIVPTYNRSGFLMEAIESLALQEIADVEMEILVIDDGSTDDTEETVKKIVSMYPAMNLRYIQQEHKGISSARNKGVMSAKGEWIGFLDSDDRWDPEKLKKQLAYLDKHPGCKIVFTRYQNFMDPSVEISPKTLDFFQNDCAPHYLASALINRELFDSSGLFCERLTVGEDTEWVMRNQLLSVDINHYVEEPLYLRRIHNCNITPEYRDKSRQMYKKILLTSLHMAAFIRNKGNNTQNT